MSELRDAAAVLVMATQQSLTVYADALSSEQREDVLAGINKVNVALGLDDDAAVADAVARLKDARARMDEAMLRVAERRLDSEALPRTPIKRGR